MSQSRQEFAYAQIRERVLDGRYGPGYRLVISDLAKEFGSSAIPVREALRRLEAEGLIQYTHNSGALVTRTTGQDYIETMQVLAVLEGYTVALAAPHVEASLIKELRSLNVQMRNALDAFDPQLFGAINRKFHFAIYDCCPNEYLVDTLRSGWLRLENVRRTNLALLPGRGPSSIYEHDALIEALANGATSNKIEMLARQHKFKTIEAFYKWQSGSGAKISA